MLYLKRMWSKITVPKEAFHKKNQNRQRKREKRQVEGVKDAFPAGLRHRGNSPGSTHPSTLSLDQQTGVTWGVLV